MKYECRYPLSSVWEKIEQEADPYSNPHFGNCLEKQLTQQGRNHSIRFGRIISKQYMSKTNLLHASCQPFKIGLESDYAQKNQITTQDEYFGLCGRNPSLREFPPNQVLDDTTIAPGRPFWLNLKVCNSEPLKKYLKEAEQDMHTSDYWNKDVQAAVKELTNITGHPIPKKERWVEYLDNIIDCTVCHHCHPLGDAPSKFYNDSTFWTKIDELETKERGYPFQYHKGKPTEVALYSLYFGYYFKVLQDRMDAKIKNQGRPKDLYIQVTSDGVLTSQLNMLGVPQAKQRPPWGSAIVYEVYKHKTETDQHAVRVLFNGKTLPVCGEDKQFCSWEEFNEKLSKFIPEEKDCQPFFQNYKEPNL